MVLLANTKELPAAIRLARTIVQGMPNPAVLLDQELEVVGLSNAYATLSGLKPRQLKRALEEGSSSFDLVSGDASRERQHARSCMQSKKAMHFAEEPVSNQKGDELTVYLTFLPVLGEDDEAVGVIQSFRDVSAEARVQSRYRELLEKERSRAENLEREVATRTRELREALDQVTRLSQIDPLTDLLNRRAFTEGAEQALSNSVEEGSSVGVLLGDVDLFKKVNDSFGHAVGDQVLVAVSRAIQEAVPDSAWVARFGGEEFITLLPDTQLDELAEAGESIRAAVAGITEADLQLEEGQGPRPTISIGMAISPQHGETLDNLVVAADQALYRAKEGGRDRCTLFDPAFASDEESAGEGSSGWQSLVRLGGKRLVVLGEQIELLAKEGVSSQSLRSLLRPRRVQDRRRRRRR